MSKWVNATSRVEIGPLGKDEFTWTGDCLSWESAWLACMRPGVQAPVLPVEMMNSSSFALCLSQPLAFHCIARRPSTDSSLAFPASRLTSQHMSVCYLPTLCICAVKACGNGSKDSSNACLSQGTCRMTRKDQKMSEVGRVFPLGFRDSVALLTP